MKKFISLLLALIMTFSVATIAFAADETTTLPDASTDAETEPGTVEDELGDFQWLLDLPLWTAKPMLKIAKIALKFVKVYLKLSAVFGNIPDGVADKIEQVIKDTIENAQKPETAPAAIA